MASNKENIITDILIELEKGIGRGACLAIIGKKWQTSDRTFDRHWKIANERHKESQQGIQKFIEEVSTVATIERLKTAILKKEEALEILTKIATTETKLTAFGQVSAKSEQISAIKTIAELEGWNEPVKPDGDNTGKTKIILSNGNEIYI